MLVAQQILAILRSTISRRLIKERGSLGNNEDTKKIWCSGYLRVFEQSFIVPA
jgi:hypothetical protein